METALMEGTNCRVVARRYEVSKSALSRHRTEHLTRELAAGRTRAEQDAERQDELLQRLDWMREGMTVMYGRHERKKPRVVLDAMKELSRLWSLEAGYRKPAGGGGDRAGTAAGNGTLQEVLRRFPGAEEALLEVAERIAREDEDKRRAA
ncbi:MAG: hypothetical protein ACKV22_08425 [Bryobacteraceae bacterium]